MTNSRSTLIETNTVGLKGVARIGSDV